LPDSTDRGRGCKPWTSDRRPNESIPGLAVTAVTAFVAAGLLVALVRVLMVA